jgi:hypothetical protein
MKCTSRLNRSSFDTATGHFDLRAWPSAAVSCGRRSSASQPLPVSTSTNSPISSYPSGRGEAGDGVPLRFDAQSALALLLGRYADVADNLAHGGVPARWTYEHTFRMRVPGGWLYRYQTAPPSPIAVMTFVPDRRSGSKPLPADQPDRRKTSVND